MGAFSFFIKRIFPIIMISFSANVFAESTTSISLNLKEVFSASPFIYSILLIMSIIALVIWLYSLLTFRKQDMMPVDVMQKLKTHLTKKSYEEASAFCNQHDHLLFKMMSSGLSTRHHGPQFMIDSIKSEGKRCSANLWQRLNLLNDIVLIAPMLGLLGTVLGMFYAFYDINRSKESITSLFDGLGIAVGTTVAGLVVAIIVMIFHTTLKYRLIKTLNHLENEAIHLSNFIETKNKK